jgi:hypothetical protein
MKYPELKGLCKNCLGCNKLELPDFTGVYRCEYAIDKQMSIEEVKKNGTRFR